MISENSWTKKIKKNEQRKYKKNIWNKQGWLSRRWFFRTCHQAVTLSKKHVATNGNGCFYHGGTCAYICHTGCYTSARTNQQPDHLHQQLASAIAGFCHSIHRHLGSGGIYRFCGGSCWCGVIDRLESDNQLNIILTILNTWMMVCWMKLIKIFHWFSFWNDKNTRFWQKYPSDPPVKTTLSASFDVLNLIFVLYRVTNVKLIVMLITIQKNDQIRRIEAFADTHGRHREFQYDRKKAADIRRHWFWNRKPPSLKRM